MLSLIITMLMILFYVTSFSYDADSFTPGEFNDPNRIMPETIYHENYEQLKSPPNTAVLYPIFTQMHIVGIRFMISIWVDANALQ